MSETNKYCVILCGGVGSRFWPYSRVGRPKQFIDFFGIGRTLLQMTYDRVRGLVPDENMIVVTNADYRATVSEQLPGLTPEQILREPVRRNTAPSIAWAAYHIKAHNPDAVIMVTPCDHLILREDEFRRCVAEGFAFAESNDALLTFGVKPNRAETAYGYIQVGDQSDFDNIYRIKTFTEKPSLDLARVFVESGEFFWNSGLFLWRADSFIKALKITAPEVNAVFENGGGYIGSENEQKYIDAFFSGCPSTTTEYAVMERAENVYVQCVDFGWNDLGSWGVLYDYSPKNRDGNVTQNCQAHIYNGTGNIVAVPKDKMVVISGLKDYIVAEEGDALLICPRSDEQRIKQYVNNLRAGTGDKYL